MHCRGPLIVLMATRGVLQAGAVVDPEWPQWGSAQTGERFEWWGWPNEGWMGVGVGSMCPEWENGGRWPMWAMWLVRPGAPPKGDDLSCMHLDSSSKLSPTRLFLLDLLDILRLRVWIPSFFMVRGLLTCGEQHISSNWAEHFPGLHFWAPVGLPNHKLKFHRNKSHFDLLLWWYTRSILIACKKKGYK